MWKFCFIENPVDPNKLNPEELLFNETQIVPGSYDAVGIHSGIFILYISGRRGSGIYKKFFELTPNSLGRIKFEVIFKSKKIGMHHVLQNNY